MTQVQQFVSRMKKRQRWDVQTMWAWDLDLWPWNWCAMSHVSWSTILPILVIGYHIIIDTPAIEMLWGYYDYSFPIYGLLCDACVDRLTVGGARRDRYRSNGSLTFDQRLYRPYGLYNLCIRLCDNILTFKRHLNQRLYRLWLEYPSIQTHLVLLCCIKRLCIFGPKGAIQICYYYYYFLYIFFKYFFKIIIIIIIYTINQHVQETSEILPLSIVFFQPVELVTTCTLTMLGALEVVRTAYCAL